MIYIQCLALLIFVGTSHAQDEPDLCESDALSQLQISHPVHTELNVSVTPSDISIAGRQPGQTLSVAGAVLTLSQRVTSLTLEAVTTRGGLIQRFELNGQNVLFQGSTEDRMDGAIFWPSPQSAWGWPPPVCIDPVPSQDYRTAYTMDIGRGNRTFSLHSPTCWGLGLEVSKKFSALENRGAIAVDYSMTGTDWGKQRFWAPWEIARVRPTGLTFYMTGSSPPWSGTWPALDVVQAAGATWYQHKEGVKNHKLFADTSEGWLAHSHGNLLFQRCFQKIGADQAAPGEGQVEIYDGGDYMEIEIQGAYVPLTPNQPINWEVIWILRPIPDSIKVDIGSTELLNFASSLCNPNSASSYL